MKLSTKLLLSFFSVAFLVLLVGTGSYFLNKSIKDSLITQNRLAIQELQLFSTLESHLQNGHQFTRDWLLVKRQEVEYETSQLQTESLAIENEARSHLTAFSDKLLSLKNGDRMQELAGRYPELNSGRTHELLDSLDSGFTLYQSLLNELYLLDPEEFSLDSSSASVMFNSTLEPYFRNTLIPILTQLRENRQTQMEGLSTRLQSEAENAARIIVFITTIAFIISSLLAYLMYLSIARPLKNLSMATEEIGAGNLEKRINIGTHDELETLGESFNRMAENLNKSMVSREYVNNIIQSMGDMLFVTDPDYKIRMVNKSVVRTLGFTEEELRGNEILSYTDSEDLLHLQDDGNNPMLLNSSMEKGFRTRNGEMIPVIISCSTLLEKTNEPEGVVFVASNISRQKEAEDKVNKSLREKEVLLAEIHHRVKNNLAVISGLLEMQVWNLQEDDISITALKESQLRIQSIALVHELLYQSETLAEIKLDEYTLKLLNAIEKMHKQEMKNIRVVTDLTPVRLTIQKAIPASLLLNELVVNTFKHAFVNRPAGEINITLEQDGKVIRLGVQDNGVGLPENFNPFNQKSLGMTLIKTLVQQMNAKLEYGPSTAYQDGSRFTVLFENE